MALENLEVQEIPLKQELEFLRKYLEIEQMRFQDRLTVEMHIAPDTLDASVPNMILQPLVENAVRHGVSPCESPGTVSISAYRAGRMLHVEVSDDGPGLQSGWRMEQCEGIGLANTVERLRRLYGTDHRFELSNGGGGAGCVNLTASNIVINEDGSAAPNNWATVTTQVTSPAPADSTTGTITDGNTNGAVTAASTYLRDSIPTLAPGASGTFVFRRKIN